MHLFTMSHVVVCGTSVPSHTKYLPLVVPLAASAGGKPLSAIRLLHQGGRHLCWSQLAAASNPGVTGEFMCTNNKQLDAKLRADKYFEVEMTVQDCELDEYGVVNNVVYASYIDKAREEMLLTLGIGTGWIISTGNAMALSELTLKYFTPLKRGNKFVVKVRVTRIKGVRILVEHLIETLPDQKLVLEGTATAVCLNMNYRPTRVFPEMSAKLNRFFSS